MKLSKWNQWNEIRIKGGGEILELSQIFLKILSKILFKILGLGQPNNVWLIISLCCQSN